MKKEPQWSMVATFNKSGGKTAYTLPPLYKKTSTGAIEEWQVSVEGPDVVTTYGHVNGKKQTARETAVGKNVGKANATTPEMQAQAQAVSDWKQKVARKGYVEDLNRASDGETDAAGGISPMLAKPHEDVATKLKYPAMMQRKYNGVRCIAVYENGACTLWSRKQESMAVPVPHIIAAVEKLFAGRSGRIVTDGELYLHGWSLQKIASYVRQKTKPKEGYEQIEYHIYDCPSHEGTNEERQAFLDKLLSTALHPLVAVPAILVNDETAAWCAHDSWVQNGYEGGIGRNRDAKYQPGKRSADLQKFKRFDESEFEVVGSTFGSGKYADIPVLTCKTAEGKEFDCNPPGTLEERRAVDRVAVVGKMLTVKHFGWTDDKKPSFPVGVVIRDYE